MLKIYWQMYWTGKRITCHEEWEESDEQRYDKNYEPFL